ncbi:hypothetical protein Nizo2766_1404 [Lactiplantibacillus plantarum]|nr:hypothetical protein Nizo2256_2713 [Lactiplantibacillus plantarum]KZU45796.1 hypothetical protein Nizo2766_1404 [Lactiplantibacillus plantarum]KZU46919.1 hypothetical protein Nizo2757_0732 [Lactiplantibacillus plantarum]
MDSLGGSVVLQNLRGIIGSKIKVGIQSFNYHQLTFSGLNRFFLKLF